MSWLDIQLYNVSLPDSGMGLLECAQVFTLRRHLKVKQIAIYLNSKNMSVAWHCLSGTLFCKYCFVTDENECLDSSHDCHSNATCVNTDGSFVCACDHTFTGDGRNCTSKQTQFVAGQFNLLQVALYLKKWRNHLGKCSQCKFRKSHRKWAY